mmetsp:Transcript_11064/g.16814  ORF Transcript_11064/g.16814 Transcript_11064/m.16814 type:complete len:181 (+) Transcript_11064:1913-2455(+)
MQTSNYSPQWNFTSQDTMFPPAGLINFFGNETDISEHTKVVVVEHESLSIIDVKRKDIKRLKVKPSQTENVFSGDLTKEFLIKKALTKNIGKQFCTIIRDLQLRPFDFWEGKLNKEENEEDKILEDKYIEVVRLTMKDSDSKDPVQPLKFPSQYLFDRIETQMQNRLIDLQVWELKQCIK